MDGSLLTFLGLAVVVIATPGPDTALTVRTTLLGGRRAGVFTALGVSVGQIAWSIATGLGLVALVLASEPIFRTIKLAGAGYLVYLGIQSLRAACRGWPVSTAALERGTGASRAGFRAFGQGVINNLANPKMAVFCASLLPQFAPVGYGMLSALLALGVLFSVLTFLWLGLYAAIVARAGRLVRGARVGRVIDATAGLALIGLGVKVALEER